MQETEHGFVPPLAPTGCGTSSVTARVRCQRPLHSSHRGSAPQFQPPAGSWAVGARQPAAGSWAVGAHQQRSTPFRRYAVFPGSSRFVGASGGDSSWAPAPFHRPSGALQVLSLTVALTEAVKAVIFYSYYYDRFLQVYGVWCRV